MGMGQLDTKQRIISAAEKLFAENGFAATSIRHVVAEAGINLAAVHYHFGSKEGLFFEILNRRFAGIEAKRFELLKQARQAEGEPPTVAGVVEAFLLPLADLLESDPNARQFGKLMSRSLLESPDLAGEVRQRFFRRTSEAFLQAIQEALPHLSPETICWRYHFLISAMTGSLAHPERLAFLSGGKIDPDDREEMVNRLVRFVCAGMEADDE